jgi:molecular chaperone GrpE
MDKKTKKVEEEKIEKKDEVAHLKQKIEELENQVKRIFADYQNLEKRVAVERREWLIKANKDLVLKLLPALDFLLLSTKHIETEGVEKIDTTEKEFDPNLMEGVKMVPGQENKIIEELRSGFKMGDQVLRPAQVTVGAGEQKKEELN